MLAQWQQREDQLLGSTCQAIRENTSMPTTDRSALHFARKVQAAFGFLSDAGFVQVEASSMLVRYRKDDVEIDIYHGRQSYEIGGGVTLAGTRYGISEIIRTVDPLVAEEYQNWMTNTPEGIAKGLEKLAALMQHYGFDVLSAEQQFIALLARQRKQWAEGYALDVLAAQLRPQAEDAFRRGDYEQAADLYGQIRERLSPVEAKKLSFAQERRAGRP
jgi:hypothetical protein